MGFWLFNRSPGENQAEALLLRVVETSRQPTLYGAGGVPDTLDGRLESMILHGVLALIRLRAEPDARRLAQNFTDLLFRHFDAGLREAGVGDMAVPKRMHRLAGDFYGRLEAYAAALAEGDDQALQAALARNLLAGAAGADAARLARYVAALSARLAEAPVAALSAPDSWALQSV